MKPPTAAFNNSKFSATNLTDLASPTTASAKPLPSVFAMSSIVFEFSSKNLSRSPNCFFNSGKNPASRISFLKEKN